MGERLRNPDNLDFRPKANSECLTSGVVPYGEESKELVEGYIGYQAGTK